jgi:hypothetical protein
MYDCLGLYYHVALNKRYSLKDKSITHVYLQIDLDRGYLSKISRKD